MTNQQTRRLLGGTAAGLFVAGAGLVAWAFWVPVGPSTAESAVVPQVVAAKSTGDRAAADFAPLLQKRLSRPLVDPPPVVKPEKPKKDKLAVRGRDKNRGVQLVGTVLESGKSLAILVDPTGSIQLRGVGDTFETGAGTVRVERIELDEVTLSDQGRTVVLQMPSSKVR